jgi:hypothetical protein
MAPVTFILPLSSWDGTLLARASVLVFALVGYGTAAILLRLLPWSELKDLGNGLMRGLGRAGAI